MKGVLRRTGPATKRVRIKIFLRTTGPATNQVQKNIPAHNWACHKPSSDQSDPLCKGPAHNWTWPKKIGPHVFLRTNCLAQNTVRKKNARSSDLEKTNPPWAQGKRFVNTSSLVLPTNCLAQNRSFKKKNCGQLGTRKNKSPLSASAGQALYQHVVSWVH